MCDSSASSRVRRRVQRDGSDYTAEGQRRRSRVRPREPLVVMTQQPKMKTDTTAASTTAADTEKAGQSVDNDARANRQSCETNASILQVVPKRRRRQYAETDTGDEGERVYTRISRYDGKFDLVPVNTRRPGDPCISSSSRRYLLGRRTGGAASRLVSLYQLLTVLWTLCLASSGFFPVVEAVSGYVPVDYGFEFNGKHSDFAQQYYLRYMAKDEVSPLTAVKTGNLPDALRTELKTYALSWEELPGLLQRALLWDTGYALTADSTIVPIYTRNNRSMAEIFVPRKAYERTGCTPRACSLPNGEIFYRHKWCDGDQMARVSLCAVDGDKTSPHAAMWGDGGEVDTIPEVRVMRHYWRDHGDEYLMYALHTLADEAVYDKCPATPAMVIPCVSNASVPDPENWGPPTRGKVVEAWLKKYAEDHQENRTWLLVPLTIVVFTLFGVITVYRFKAAVREPLDDDDSTFTKNDLDFDSGSVEAFLMSPRDGANDDSDSSNDVEQHPEGDLNAAAFEYFDASIGLSASAFDPMMMASHPRIHPLQRSARSMWGKVHASKRNEVAIRSFRLFESHRKIRQLRVPFREIQVTKLLSSGATGEVWLATHRTRQVAVKQLIPAKRRKLKEMEMFMAEIYLLAQLKHDNIVSLVGIAWNTLEHIVMVQELMEMGDLQQFLATQRKQNQQQKQCHVDGDENEGSSTTMLFTWEQQRLHVAQSVAAALAYMHRLTPKLLHLDVKSRNVLLSNELKVVKLCDFGISRRKYNADEDDNNLTVTAAIGTMSWTAPELLVGDDYSEKVDIYSFGVLLTELDTCQLPYHDPQSLELKLVQYPLRLMKRILNEGYRPKLSSSCPPHIAQLVASCLSRDPEARPSARDICAMLKSDAERVSDMV